MTVSVDEFGPVLGRRVLVRYLLLGFVLLIAVSAAGTYWTQSEDAWSTVFVIGLVGFGAAALYLHNSKCPKCGNRFAVRSDHAYYNSFTVECLTCGLSQESLREGK